MKFVSRIRRNNAVSGLRQVTGEGYPAGFQKTEGAFQYVKTNGTYRPKNGSCHPTPSVDGVYRDSFASTSHRAGTIPFQRMNEVCLHDTNPRLKEVSTIGNNGIPQKIETLDSQQTENGKLRSNAAQSPSIRSTYLTIPANGQLSTIRSSTHGSSSSSTTSSAASSVSSSSTLNEEILRPENLDRYIDLQDQFRIAELDRIVTPKWIRDCENKADLIAVVHAFAAHRFPAHNKFVEISKKLVPQLFLCNWDEISIIAWAYSVNQEADQDLFIALAEVMLRKMDRASTPNQLIKSVAAFVRLNLRDDRLLYMLGKKIRSCLKQDMLDYYGENSTRISVTYNYGTRNATESASSDTSMGSNGSCSNSIPSNNGSTITTLAHRDELDIVDVIEAPGRRQTLLNLSTVSSLFEVWARTHFLDAAAIRRVMKWLNVAKPNFVDRNSIGRLNHYMMWVGVWNPEWQAYMRDNFLYSSRFEDCRQLIRFPPHANLDTSEFEPASGEITEEQKSHATNVWVIQQNLSQLILTRMTMATHSLWGHMDERFLDNLLRLYQNGLSREKSHDLDSTSGSNTTTAARSTDSPTGIRLRTRTEDFTQQYGAKRFVQALCAVRFWGDFNNFKLQTLRNLMPDVTEFAESRLNSMTDNTQYENDPAFHEFDPTAMVDMSAITIHPEHILYAPPESTAVGGASVLHEEVSAAIEATYAGKQHYEPVCGIYLVDTLLM